jgi:hypothetical protein
MSQMVTEMEEFSTPEDPQRNNRPPPRKKQRRALPRKVRWPDLTVEQILAWADAHHTQTGEWPTAAHGGLVADAPREKWRNIDTCLRQGLRGLPRGLSLARLLAQYRGVRNRKALPPYTEDQVLAWADAYRDRTGQWPTGDSGPIQDAPGETWTAVDVALAHGIRGLPGGSSLAQLLAERRGLRNKRDLPPLTVEQVLAWADAFYERHGYWPQVESGPIQGAAGETWQAVNHYLNRGSRGLPGGSSLAQLLAQEHRVRNRMNLPLFSLDQILAWADTHHSCTGEWPKRESGPIPDAPGDTWAAVDGALHQGCRGLPGGSSLVRLLAERRGTRNRAALPEFPTRQILAWADAFYGRHGRWPNKESGAIEEAPGETWAAVDSALEKGNRGLPGGSSLARLLAARRGARNQTNLPPLTVERILVWADTHHQRTGKWPNDRSGTIQDAPAENWKAIDGALRRGHRGLPGGSTLARLLKQHRERPTD